MIFYHLKIAWRNLVKNPYYSILNILGLSVGLCCFAFIFIWTNHELSFDKFHSQSDRIYRINNTVTQTEGVIEQATTPPPLASSLKQHIPEVKHSTRLDINDAILRVKEEVYSEDDIVFTDPSFFEVFDFPLVRGDISTCLSEPYSLVLTESVAQKFYGATNPMGKSLTMLLYDPDGNGAPYKITGIMADPPTNSHIQYTMLGSFATIESIRPNYIKDWTENEMYTYVVLDSYSEQATLDEKLKDFAQSHIPSSIQQSENSYTFSSQALSDIHLNAELRNEIAGNGDSRYVYLFMVVSLLILLMASINYINLATAKSIRRLEEMVVRKVLGAERIHLIVQIILEAMVVSLLALALALFLLPILQPIFSQLTGISTLNMYDLSLVSKLVAITLVLGCLSGLYPALYVSGKRTSALAHKGSQGHGQHFPVKKVLVVAQFTVCMVILMGLMVVRQQMQYIQQKKLGFEREARLNLKVNGSGEVIDHFAAFRNDILAQPSVMGVAQSNSTLVGVDDEEEALFTYSSGKRVQSEVYTLRSSPEFFEIHQVPLVAGRYFQPGNKLDSTQNFIVNLATVQKLGWEQPEMAVGNSLEIDGRSGQIVGVVEDFHFSSLKHKIEPLAISGLGRRFSQITLKLAPGNVSESLESVETIWKKHFPGSLFDYRFLEDAVQKQYTSEIRLSRLFTIFFITGQLIALFGLLGLSAFTAELRTKEIGIRKVLGASVMNIVEMLSKSFVQLVGISFLLAVPIGVYFMNHWLQNFAYQTQINIWTFVISGAATLFIALLTVSLQSMRAAVANPVDSIRDQ